MTSSSEEAIRISTGKIMLEIEDGRRAAHRKHGENSIEAVPADDIARWLPILGEEFGEVNECLTYDKDHGNLRNEIIDLITVGVAWVAAIDRQQKEADDAAWAKHRVTVSLAREVKAGDPVYYKGEVVGYVSEPPQLSEYGYYMNARITDERFGQAYPISEFSLSPN